jgi:hypothetical protein
MKRRQFIAAHGGAWSQPWAINAQQTDRVRPVGRYLEAMVKLFRKGHVEAFQQPSAIDRWGNTPACQAARDLTAQVASPIARLDAKMTLRSGDGKAQFPRYRPALPND